VDSTVCLKKLVDQGLTPNILHFRTKKLTKDHEKKILKVARALSPKSKIIVYPLESMNYVGVLDSERYWVEDKTGKRNIYPDVYGSPVVIGYCKDANDSQDIVFRWLGKYQDKYQFPLKNMTFKEVDEEYFKLPKVIRNLVVSSTRNDEVFDKGIPDFEYIGMPPEG